MLYRDDFSIVLAFVDLGLSDPGQIPVAHCAHVEHTAVSSVSICSQCFDEYLCSGVVPALQLFFYLCGVVADTEGGWFVIRARLLVLTIQYINSFRKTGIL